MDVDEFRNLVEKHGRTVFSIALRITRDEGTAEEVTQDVFLELHRASGRFETEDHVRFWLRRVAVHRSTDALRRRRRQPEKGAEPWIEEQHGTAWAEGGGTGARGSELRNGMAQLLESAVGSLPEAMRVALILRYGEEMTPDEISQMLGQPLPTVKSNLQRGLKLLRQKAAVTMKEYVREQRA